MKLLKETKVERIERFREIMEPFFIYSDQGCSGLVYELDGMGFFTAPASSKYHGAYEGGLFDHSYNVTKCLIELTENNKLLWDRGRSPYLVGMFHDLCKCDQYEKDYDGIYHFNEDTLLKGHGEKSVMLLSQFYSLTEEEVLCIRYHMGAFTDQKEWNDYTRAIHRYPNVLFTHTADMMAAHVMEVDNG